MGLDYFYSQSNDENIMPIGDIYFGDVYRQKKINVCQKINVLLIETIYL